VTCNGGRTHCGVVIDPTSQLFAPPPARNICIFCIFVYLELWTLFANSILCSKFDTVFCFPRSRKLRLTTVGDPPRWPRNTPLSTKVGTKFRRQVVVNQSVKFACGVRATEFVCLFVCSAFHWFHSDFWFKPDDGGHIFLRNFVRFSTDCGILLSQKTKLCLTTVMRALNHTESSVET
jgi:hypothetical protein